MQSPAPDPGLVREFRQILLWPLQLLPLTPGASLGEHWQLLDESGGPWSELADEFTADPAHFQERHYQEFTTFLPYVQRLLYGEGPYAARASLKSPIRVYRRRDVSHARLVFSDRARAPLLLKLVHLDLYFFRGMDLAMLALELQGSELSVSDAQECLYRLGRIYPTQWTAEGRAQHCFEQVDWIAADGTVLASSDYQARDRYLEQVCRQRAPRIAAHWEYLLHPLVPHHSDAAGALRYRLLDQHRLPVMGFLAVDDPYALSRADFVRLALLTAPGPAGVLPFSEADLLDFEKRCCADRYWRVAGADANAARYLCSGAALLLVGRAADRHLIDLERGLLAQFRHQYFLLFLFAHFQKAALYMISDRLVDAISHLQLRDPDSIRTFKRKIRELKRTLLNFSHGYWFRQISAQPLVQDLYHKCQDWLDSERIYAEVRDEVEAMNDYLDSDSLRRQASTVVRLTVVTMFGLIGTITTGFLGMNLLAAADSTLSQKFGYFLVVFVPTIWLTLYTIMKSQRLSDFLDALSDERLPARAKLGALLEVWRRRP